MILNSVHVEEGLGGVVTGAFDKQIPQQAPSSAREAVQLLTDISSRIDPKRERAVVLWRGLVKLLHETGSA